MRKIALESRSSKYYLYYKTNGIQDINSLPYSRPEDSSINELDEEGEVLYSFIEERELPRTSGKIFKSLESPKSNKAIAPTNLLE